jgi:hypothetical protein
MIKLKKLISENLINEATRSQIGVITKKGNILSTYVHYDGYPDGVGATAKKYYSGGKVNQLLKVDGGVGISVLDKKMDGGKDHSFANPAKDQTIFYGRDRGEKGGKHLKGYLDGIETYIKDAGNKAGADYVYLYNEKDKKWYYADVYSDKELKLLEGVKESVNEGKHDAMLDKLADIVKDAKSFMDIGSGLKKAGIKYSFGTNMIPMYIIDKPTKIAILNNKYADGAERVVGSTAIGLMEGMVAEVTYDLGMARKGNGLTIYNKAEEEKGDYKNIAHVDNKGKIKFYDKKLPSKIKKQIEDEAKKMIESMNENKSTKLKSLLNESFGIGELPSSKLIKMKVSFSEIMNEGRASAKKLLQSVVKGETSRVEGIKMSKEMAQSFLDWQRLSPYGKKYGDLPFHMLFKAAFNWGLHRHADKKSKEYKELEAKAKTMKK